MKRLALCLVLLTALITGCAPGSGAEQAIYGEDTGKLRFFQYVFRSGDGQHHGFALSAQGNDNALFAVTGLTEHTSTVNVSAMDQVDALIAQHGADSWPALGQEEDAQYTLFMEWYGGEHHLAFAGPDDLPEGYQELHEGLMAFVSEYLEAAEDEQTP